ncbi:CREB/ATF bZIP transcription factor-like [Tubulanus polymorphus]|uniref:CREB/ATF bZIP transcription factor-like n=1 Tax=Tubulanus polymorphus TaxID=672921 RepID=UPI003DA48C15
MLVPRTRVSSRIAARPVVAMTSADKDHGYVLKLADNTTENQHQNKLPKAPKSVYSKIVEDPGVDKTTKTVIQARLNRQKKKEYIQGLESQVTKFKSENVELRQREKQWEKHRKSLEEEIVYLKSVLANDSRLSSLLKNINGLKNVHLSSAFSQKRKIDADHDYLKRDRVGSATGGVCLHVDSDEVSLEFCSRCSNQSKRSRSTVDDR